MSQDCPIITLNNGVAMPQIGIGMWLATLDEAAQNVKWAVQAGYRHIDTAHFYKNEVAVGKGIKECGVPREEIFLTTKLWNNAHGYDNALAAFEESRAALGVDYIDLFLIHWPGPNKESYIDTWRALEKLYAEKKVRAIGVSNFEEKHLDNLLAACKVVPAVNQVELHPLFQREGLRNYCKGHNIAVTGWRPLGKGTLLTEETIVKLADKHKRTPAQIILRWFVQVGVIAIPKSSREERIKENFNIFDFVLDDSDMQEMKSLDQNNRLGFDPETFFPTAFSKE